METYYCDGSQHKELNKLGIGVVKGSEKRYYNVSDFEWRSMCHEIYAITEAIKLAIEHDSKHIVVVNDDRQLVDVIQKAKINMKMKSKNFKKKTEFRRMLNLVKKHDVFVRTPQSEFDKQQILKCHHLSRSYMKEMDVI